MNQEKNKLAQLKKQTNIASHFTNEVEGRRQTSAPHEMRVPVRSHPCLSTLSLSAVTVAMETVPKALKCPRMEREQ